jgi:hypothetical protein
VKGYIAVEGHGDILASANLVARLSVDLGLEVSWSTPLRWRNLHQEKGLVSLSEVIRARSDVARLLVVRDEDDACPREQGPELAEILRRQNLPFPAAVVLLHREYEALFLASMDSLAGRTLGAGAAERPGILAGSRFEGNPESVRGVKEWLSSRFPQGKSYKPSLDQLPLTRLIDFELVRRSDLPCFGTLERALRFLATNPVGVYPPLPEPRG